MSQQDPRLSYELYITAPAAPVGSARTEGAPAEPSFSGHQ